MNQDDAGLKMLVDFSSLSAWFKLHCNGTWEHTNGIKLETLDNPGWKLTVDLTQTDLQGQKMDQISEGCSPKGEPRSPRWIHCVIKNNQFSGACDPSQLSRLIRLFNLLLESRDELPKS